MNKMTTKVHIVSIFPASVIWVLTIASLKEFAPASAYEFRTHETVYSHYTMCNGTIIKSKIYGNESSKYWLDCQNVTSSSGETALSAFWRVYTCVLAKHVPATQTTISLTEFADIMLSNYYPASIKESINSSVNLLTSKSNESNLAWLKQGVQIKDYKNLNKIRAQYFDIEKEVCGGYLGGKIIPIETPWNNCSNSEEYYHRGASCCGNYTIPFSFHSQGRSTLALPTTCNQTLKKFLDKFDKDDKAKKLAIFMCKVPCYLIENSMITIEDLLSLNQTTAPPFHLIVEHDFPYLPSHARKQIQDKALAEFNGTAVMEELKTSLHAMNYTQMIEKADLFYKCHAYRYAAVDFEIDNSTCQDA